MNEQGEKNLTRNTTYYIAALIVQKIISFTYFSILATQLGSENIGKYFLAISFASIFHIFIDLGIINILIRDTARDQNQAQHLFSLNLAIKLPLTVVIFVLINFLSQLLGYSEELKSMIALTAIIMILDNFIITFYGMFRAYHNLKFESFGTIIFQIIVFLSGLLILQFTKKPLILLVALLLASLFNFIYSLTLIIVKLKLNIRPLFLLVEIKKLLKKTIPFTLAGIFTKIYAYIDTVFLSLFVSAQAIGYYSLPYKMTFSLQFIPLAFMASLYPLFSTYYNKNQQTLTNFYQQSLFYLLLIILPISLGTILLADQIILTIYGQQFQPSILSLQILMIGLIFVFLNFPAGNLLNACHRQKLNSRNIGLIMVLNIILNLILMKIFNLSFIGASLASSISSILLFIINFIITLKLVNFNFVNFSQKMLKLILSLVIMLLAVGVLKNYLIFIVNIIFAGLIYFILIFLTGCLKIEDLKIFLQSVFKKDYEKNTSFDT